MSPSKNPQQIIPVQLPCDSDSIPSFTQNVDCKPEPGTLTEQGTGEKSTIHPTNLVIEVDEPSPSPPYSVFTTAQKQWIVFIAASADWFSTASSFIYFPAIPFLAAELNVSVQMINLTVTSYLIASGIFPALIGSAADQYGRRPVFIVAIGAYIGINVGLAVQCSFAVLITLHIFQSAAISRQPKILMRTFAFAYGVLGDLTTPANRGNYIGFISILQGILSWSYIAPRFLEAALGLTDQTKLSSLNTPPSVAPLISGLLLIRWKWSAIFWFLSTVSAVVFISIVLFFPETCRRIVGNGSIRPRPAGRALIPLLYPADKVEHSSPPAGPKSDFKRVMNPLAPLALLKGYGTGLAVFCYGVYYTIYSCLQASLSTIFVEVYGVSGLIAGLSYIPFGVACIIASTLAGKLLDYDYRRTARSLGLTVDRRKVDDLADFPIEYARFRTCKYFIALCAPLIIGYGWTLQAKTHIAVPLTLQFFIGFTNQVNFTSLNALLIDLHPTQPSAIQAANNVFRCALAAGGIALLDVLLRWLGAGWCFVVYAALHSVTLPALWVMERYGLAWRRGNK